MAGPAQSQAAVGPPVRLEEPDYSSANWYFSRDEVEKSSPSRKDGIDLKKESYYRKSYCTFLQELGMKLEVPQVTIATAIVFCHRFFLRQSHARNDRHMVATICLFLAGKVEETPRRLQDVVKISYAIRHKKDPAATQRIKDEKFLNEQKDLLLLGEKLVLATLGFDLNVYHPYKPLVAAIRKFKVAQSALAQVAWNFVNDGLRTSLCLQFKPHHIAAGAIFLAAKFLKVKLPCDGEKAWWQEFEVSPRQLEEVSNQMLELYEQNKPAINSRSSDPSASVDANAESCPSPSPGQLSSQTEARDASRDIEASKKTSTSSGEVVLSPSVDGTTEVKKEVAEEAQLVVSSEPGVVDKQEEIDTIDEVKLKAAREKRRKLRVETAEVTQKQDVTDEELLERELENGIEVAAEAGKVKQEAGELDTKPVVPKPETAYKREDRGRHENGDMHRDGRRGLPPSTIKRERTDDTTSLDSAAKRKRPSEDVHTKTVKAEPVVEEEGELPPSDLPRSPPRAERRPPSPYERRSLWHDRPHDRRPVFSPYDRRPISPYDNRRREYNNVRGDMQYPPRREAYYDKPHRENNGYRHRDYYHHHPHHPYQQAPPQQQQQQHGRELEWHRPSRENWRK